MLSANWARRLAAIAAALLTALLIASAPALATTQTARAGTVSALLSYRGSGIETRALTLQINRGSDTVYRRAVTGPNCNHECEPLSVFAHRSALRIVSLNGSAEPQVILSLFTGGANCCVIDEIFSYSPAKLTYTKVSRDFGDAGARITDLGQDGRYEFVSADPDFKYQFTDGAASGEPVQVFRLAGGRFENVTRHYPGLIAADATDWLKAFRQNYSDSVGLIAAWAADEDELGHAQRVSTFLNQQAAAGHLNSALSPQQPGGRRFIGILDRFLRRHGYLH